MGLKYDYQILKPIKLQWEFVSPTEEGGLEYHLSPQLSLKLEGIVTGDMVFNIADELIAFEGIQANELQKEEVFLNEFLPNKSKERIMRAFRDEKTTCFFNSRQIAHFEKLFSERNFISYHVSFFYKERKVDRAEYLGPKEFDLAKEVIIELDIQWKIDGKYSIEEIEKDYKDGIQKNAGKMAESAKLTTSDKFRNKKFLKRVAIGLGSVMVGIGGIVIRTRLASCAGPWTAVAAVLIGTIGIIMEAYGREEMFTNMRHFRME